MPSPLVLVAAVLGVLAVLFLVTGFAAIGRRRWIGGTFATLLAALCFAIAALAATIAVSVQGYRALTHEEVAATVRTEPMAPREFRATVTLADGRVLTFDLAGDALYVDAHILKWRPIVNVLGLHTAYELDRIAGRWDQLADEQRLPRTVYSLAQDKAVNAFDLARRYKLFGPLVDAEYGSATFIGALRPATFEIRVSTTGLLVRRVDPPAR